MEPGLPGLKVQGDGSNEISLSTSFASKKTWVSTAMEQSDFRISFTSITVTPDGKQIRFENGLIPVGGRFTDIHLARAANPPFLAAVDASLWVLMTLNDESDLQFCMIGLQRTSTGWE